MNKNNKWEKLLLQNFAIVDLVIMEKYLKQDTWPGCNIRQFLYRNRKRLSCANRFVGYGMEKIVFVSRCGEYVFKFSLSSNSDEFHAYTCIAPSVRRYFAKAFACIKLCDLYISVQSFIPSADNNEYSLEKAVAFMIDLCHKHKIDVWDIHDGNIIISSTGPKLVDYSI